MNPPLTAATPGGSALLTVLGWAFIVLGLVALPISLISGAMVITGGYGTRNADAAGLFTVVLGPAAVLVCGVGLLRHWTWAWWGAVLLALLVLCFSLKDALRKPAPSFTYTSEAGTQTTVYSSGGGLAAIMPLLLSGGVLVLLLLPQVRGHFRLTNPSAPIAPGAPAVSPLASDSECAAIQQEIIAALRGGAEFRTAHKEGGTTIRWQRGRFLREDYGDWSERAAYTNEAEFLAFLRRFFEWESSGFQAVDLTEPERWRNIQRLLHGDSTPGGATLTPVREISPLWKPAAFVIAAAAVALLVWLRGGVHFRNLTPLPPEQKLDTIDGKPPQVSQPDFKIPRPSAQ